MSRAHASMPPCRFFTLVKPWAARKSAARWLRLPPLAHDNDLGIGVKFLPAVRNFVQGDAHAAGNLRERHFPRLTHVEQAEAPSGIHMGF